MRSLWHLQPLKVPLKMEPQTRLDPKPNFAWFLTTRESCLFVIGPTLRLRGCQEAWKYNADSYNKCWGHQTLPNTEKCFVRRIDTRRRLTNWKISDRQSIHWFVGGIFNHETHPTNAQTCPQVLPDLFWIDQKHIKECQQCHPTSS